MAEEKNFQIDWSDFAVGVGAFAATGALGYTVSGIVSKRLKLDTYKLMLAAVPPAVGAGIIAYFLRRDCPPCPPVPREAFVRRELPEVLLGYGAVRTGGDDIISSIGNLRSMLNELGYSAGSGHEMDERLSGALLAFQEDWGFPATGQINPDVTWGIEEAYLAKLEEDKKSKMKYVYWGLGLAGAAGVVGAVYLTTKGKKRKKRSKK